MGRVSRMLNAAAKPSRKKNAGDHPAEPTVDDLVKALSANPNLVRVVKAWPNLPVNIKSAILLLLDTATAAKL